MTEPKKKTTKAKTGSKEVPKETTDTTETTEKIASYPKTTSNVKTTALVNRRSEPCKGNNVIGTSIPGTTLKVVGEAGEWFETDEGYVMKSLTIPC